MLKYAIYTVIFGALAALTYLNWGDGTERRLELVVVIGGGLYLTFLTLAQRLDRIERKLDRRQ